MKKIILTIALALSTAIYSQTGIHTANPQGVFHIDGRKDNPITGIPSATQQKNDFVVTSAGNVGIGTTNPNSDAALEINATNKGFFPPRLALTGSNDITTISSPSIGMIVYNTTTSATLNKGVTYYDGTSWKQLVPASSANSSAVVDLLSDATTGNSLSGSTSGATVLNFGTITAPSDGSYAFSFRLYGTLHPVQGEVFFTYIW